MEPHELSRHLRDRGLVILGVSRHRTNPDVLFVYLHGNHGQWMDGRALTLITKVPGVVAVAESVQTPTILLVRFESAQPSR